MRTLRADLHVHSWQSRHAGNMRFLKSRDCYSNPEDVYRVAKARGMDLVTITDHDSIDGCLEFLDRHPDADDFFISEEVSCRLPEGNVEVHLGVYGTNERLHRELQPLRGNVFDVAARLREAGVFFALNHLLHFYRRQLPLTRYLRLLDVVPALEVRNGTMLPEHNALAEQVATLWRGGPFGVIGGSDAHTLRRIGCTWTEAPGETVADFLASLAKRQSRAAGDHGSVSDVARDAYEIIGRYVGSLVGRGPCDQDLLRRAACLTFSIISLPAQFVPLAIVASGKRREAREVHRVGQELSASLVNVPIVASPAATAPKLESQA
jgi:predicted metal-dependent phosphoesterase TrpH